jgi:hypothetical protein
MKLAIIKQTVVLLLTGLALASCASPQCVQIMSDPSGAHIFVNEEYVGQSPCNYEIANVDSVKALEIRARIRNKDIDGALLRKRSDGYFPSKSILVLDDPTPVAGDSSNGPTVICPPIVTGQQNYTGPTQQSGSVVPSGPNYNNTGQYR